jgi:threonyl-tRNA synthetase
VDDRNEKVNFKIREAQLQKVPYMLVVGGREADGGTVSVRHRTRGDLGQQAFESFLSEVLQEIKTVPRND